MNSPAPGMGTTPPATVPSATALPTGALPAGASPAGASPAGALPAGASPAGALPTGALPTGALPAEALPAGALSAPVTAAARLRWDTEAALVALHVDPESFSPLDEHPMVLVDAASPGALGVAALTRHLPCVGVAVARDPRRVPPEIVAAGFDILLTDDPGAPRPWVSPPGGIEAAVDLLSGAVAAHPFAAVALVQLLRLSRQGDVRDAVVAESFAYSALQAGPEFAAWLAAHRQHRATRRPDRQADDAAPAAGVAAPDVRSPQDDPSSRDVWSSRDVRSSRDGRSPGDGRSSGDDPSSRDVRSRDDRRGGEGGPPHAGENAPEPAVLIRRDGPALTVILNRPRMHNAVNTGMRDALVAAFRLAAVDDDVTEIRLAGAGPSFSSGGDLTEFGTLPDPGRAHAVRTGRSIPLSLLAARVPKTAYVHGRCIGAGAELSAFCDRVIAAPDTTFRLPEIAMGLVPGAGGTASLPRRIGRHRASYLILSGQQIGADQALAWGLVDAIEPRSAMPVAPGLAAPGLVAPDLAAPGLVAPDLAAPGSVAPDLAAPGSVAPDLAAPGSVAPD
ncbi:enoyl-CoA hydratase-related protein [Frankia sp. AiPa1]|uniref:enoyl-CoA hydratase-related protein n=1 Tax=Frankia sp. AiPa1 TaxID=573492 RepID=UPI0027E3D842|nr:enoyl-CoA hydratase-related protein [Frankia sp. AiPa1]